MAGTKSSGRRFILSAAHRQFIALYLANNGHLEATCRGLKILPQTARNWMKQPDFLAEMGRRQEILSGAANVTAAEVIGTLASQMRADIADLLPDEEIVVAARKRGVSHLIQSIKIKKIHRLNGEVEVQTELKVVDAGKAAIQLSKLMGLETRDDAKERARNAVRALMDLNQCSPEEAISILAPHNPHVNLLRDEFAGSGPIIQITKGGDDE
jgi:hypothetical protein